MYFYWFFHWLNNFQKHQIVLDASSYCVNWLSTNNLASWLDHVAATATRQSSELAIIPSLFLWFKLLFICLSKKGKALLNITSNLQLHVPCFWKQYNIFVVSVVESLCITCTALTLSHCAHNSERIFRFQEWAMWMF